MARPFSMVWVAGLGGVGSALVAQLAKAGYTVTGVETDPAALERGWSAVEAALGKAVTGRAELKAAGSRISYATDSDLLPNADLVIEALPELFEDKIDVLRRAGRLCGPGTVFATTTTGLSVTEIASAVGRMPQTIGLHLNSLNDPANALRGIEVVSTPLTDETVRERMDMLVRDLGCASVRVADLPGFLGGGLVLHYLNNAAKMYEQGYASREDIDTAMKLGCGLPYGPLAHLDVMGIDTVICSLSALAARTGDRSYVPAPILTRMVRSGLLGRKTGRGFYTYENGNPVGAARTTGTPDGLMKPLHCIGIAGSGTMATGIATVFAQAGHPTILLARDETKAKEALSCIEGHLSRRVRGGKLSEEAMAAAMGQLTGTSEPEAFGDRDLVIETVAEDIDVKRSVLAMLDGVTPPDTILATSTSSLSVTECAIATKRPERVLGLHFFNPATAMKLVEVVHTFLTDGEVVSAATELVRSMGKVAVQCGDRTGFIVNALLFPYLNRAVRLLSDRFASTDDVDNVMTMGYGYPLGPLRLLDVIGLDVSLAIQQRLYDSFDEPTLAPARYLVDLVEAGYTGVKSGRGFRAC